MTVPAQEDSYTEEEAQRRFEAIVRGAGKTPPKPLNDRPRELPEAKGRVTRKVNPNASET